MKYKWDKKYLYWGITAFCVILAYLLLNTLLTNLAPVKAALTKLSKAMMPVTFGFTIAYLLVPVMNFFEKKCFRRLFSKMYERSDARKLSRNKDYVPKNHTQKIRSTSRGLGVAASLLVAVVIVAGLVYAVIPQVIETLRTLSGVDYIKTMHGWATNLFAEYPPIYDAVSHWIDNLYDYVTQFAQTYILPEISNILTNVSSGIMSTVNVFINVLIGLIISVYFLSSKELFAAQGKKVLYGLLKTSTANTIIRNLRDIHKKFGGFIVGKLIDSLIMGMLFFIVLTIFGMPYTLLISVVLGVTNIIPIFGPFIGAIPCGILILFDDPIKCVYFIIIVLVMQQFDGNVIGPKILGDNTGLSSFWVIFALLLGQYFFGFVGLIIGIPLFAVFYSLFKDFIGRRLKRKDFAEDTNYYRQLGYYEPVTGEAVPLSVLHKIEEDERQQKLAEKAATKHESVVSKKIKNMRKDKKSKKDKE